MHVLQLRGVRVLDFGSRALSLSPGRSHYIVLYSWYSIGLGTGEFNAEENSAVD